ncbi:MAG TPA: hypothetical protein PLG34_00265 [Spirochaetota bacterium]|nr:MAG: hypothetical protein BWX91_00364 [Spirochaetes bacterium ADurb.Bin133]HPY86401.1 hypothetical protein [Spirochaetota bacterium]
MKRKKFLLVMLLLLLTFSTFAKSNIDLKRMLLGFKFGIGFSVQTPNMLGLIESAKMYEAINKGEDYNYPGLTDEQKDALKSLDVGMQSAIITANILAGLEYGVKFRFMYHMLIADADLAFLPFDGSYNGRIDLGLSLNAGIRAPFFIQPYLMTGILFNFSFYPDEFLKVEEWKSNYAGFKNFLFRPGMHFRLGLELNFISFTIGLHYQYAIKDFDEFTRYYNSLASISGPSDAATKIFCYQSKVGFDMVWYIVK